MMNQETFFPRQIPSKIQNFLASCHHQTLSLEPPLTPLRNISQQRKKKNQTEELKNTQELRIVGIPELEEVELHL